MASLVIARISFERVAGRDTWVSACGRIKFWLCIQHAGTPWRASLDGERCNSRYSTPFLAVVRAKERMKNHASV